MDWHWQQSFRKWMDARLLDANASISRLLLLAARVFNYLRVTPSILSLHSAHRGNAQLLILVTPRGIACTAALVRGIHRSKLPLPH